MRLSEPDADVTKTAYASGFSSFSTIAKSFATFALGALNTYKAPASQGQKDPV